MDLFDRARQMLQGLGPTEPPRAQSYDVACPEGHRLSGQRTEGYQALRCPTCGEGVFILPRSPLPDPPRPAETARPARREPSPIELAPIALSDPPAAMAPPPVDEPELIEEEVEAEIEWVDPEPAAPPPPAPPRAPARPAADRPRPRAQPQPQPRPRRAPAAAAVAGPERPRIAVPERPGLGEWAARNRHALIFAGVGLLVVLTVGFRVWQQRRADLPRVAEAGLTEGLPALDAGEFDVAKKKLGDAARAVDALGGAIERSADIRQGAREAAIFADLVPSPLEAILDEAASSEEGATKFEALYKGRSILVEGTIVSTPADSSAEGFDLNYRVFVGPSGATRPAKVGRLNLTGFRLFERSEPRRGDRVTFGARLASLTLDDASGVWQFGLEPDSGVIITHFKALRALGWMADDEGSGDSAP